MNYDKKNIGDVKSLAHTVTFFTDAITRNLLGEDEVLSTTPASFVNVMADLFGTMNAANFYESIAIRAEAVKSTAKTKRSLIRYLDSKEIKGVFANPARMTFNISIRTADLKNWCTPETAVSDVGIDNLFMFTINKDSELIFEDKPAFRFEANVNVFVKRIWIGDQQSYQHSYYAMYDTKDVSIIRQNTSGYINTFITWLPAANSDVEEEWLTLTIPMYQLQRTYIDFDNLTSINKRYEYEVAYENELIGFEVFHKGRNAEEYGKSLVGQPEGILYGDPYVGVREGYNFNLAETLVGNRSFTVKFSRDPSYFSPRGNGDSLRIVVYTTRGIEGNFNIKEWDDENPPIRNLFLAQDVSDEHQKVVTNLQTYVTLSDWEAVEGRNEMSLDDLRRFVIRKSDSKLVTPVEIASLAESNDMRVNKERYDIFEFYYRLSSFLRDQDIIYDTISADVDLKNVETVLPRNTDASRTYMISPIQDLIYVPEELEDGSINPDSRRGSFVFLPPATSMVDGEKSKMWNDPYEIDQYVQRYNANVEGSRSKTERRLFYPYFMYITLQEFIKCRIFNVDLSISRPMAYRLFDPSSPSMTNVHYANIIRDPLRESIEIAKKSDDENDKPSTVYKGQYIITFNIQFDEPMGLAINEYIEKWKEYQENKIAGEIEPVSPVNFYFVVVDKFKNRFLMMSTLSPEAEMTGVGISPLESAGQGTASSILPNTYQVTAILQTDATVDAQNRMKFTNVEQIFSATGDKLSKFVDPSVSIEVFIGFKDQEPVSNTLAAGYGGSDNVYEPFAHFVIEDIQLYEELTNIFKPIIDLKVTDDMFEYFHSNILSRYTFESKSYLESKYYTSINANGNIAHNTALNEMVYIGPEDRVDYDNGIDPVNFWEPLRIREYLGVKEYEYLETPIGEGSTKSVSDYLRAKPQYSDGDLPVGVYERGLDDFSYTYRYGEGEDEKLYQMITDTNMIINGNEKIIVPPNQISARFYMKADDEWYRIKAKVDNGEGLTDGEKKHLEFYPEVDKGVPGRWVEEVVWKVIPWENYTRDTEYPTDTIVKYGSDLLSWHKGDRIPDMVVPYENILQILDLPMIDRIHYLRGPNVNFHRTVELLTMSINRLQSIQSVAPTGISYKLGLMNTVNFKPRNKTYYFADLEEKQDVFLKDIALSFSLGVKFGEDVVEEAHTNLVTRIKEEIVKYIYERRLDQTVHFMKMLNYIKDLLQVIDYFEIYDINGYNNTSFRAVLPLVEEKRNFDLLTVKKKVIYSADYGVSFEPNINISIIKE